MTDPITHRADSGRNYRGILVHAAEGVHRYAADLATRLLPLHARILDVGSGSGGLAARLDDAGFDVLGSELDTTDYRARPPVVQWDAASATLPPGCTPASFDAVCAVEMFEHVENPRQALRNFMALLKPGGRLIVSTPNVTHIRSRLKFLLRSAPSYFGRTEYFGSGHTTLMPDWMLELHVRGAGFRDVDVSYVGRLGLTGKQALLYQLAEPVPTLFQLLPAPRVDDRCVTFVVARKPAHPAEPPL